MNQNFVLLQLILVNFFLLTPKGSKLHQIIPPPSSFSRNPVYYSIFQQIHFVTDTRLHHFVFNPTISVSDPDCKKLENT